MLLVNGKCDGVWGVRHFGRECFPRVTHVLSLGVINPLFSSMCIK